MNSLRQAFGLILAFSASAGPAAATQINFVVTGTVGDVGGSQAVFGSDLATGDPFTASFAINDNDPQASYSYNGVFVGNGNPFHPSYRLIPGSEVNSGSNCEASSGDCTVPGKLAGSGKVEVGKASVAFGSSFPDLALSPSTNRVLKSYGLEVRKLHPGPNPFGDENTLYLHVGYSIFADSLTNGALLAELNFHIHSPFFTSTDWREPLSIDLAPGSSSGEADRSHDMIGDGPSTTVEFIPEHLTVSTTPDGAVPEPSTWLLYMAGLGFTGMMLRRRSAIAAVVGSNLQTATKRRSLGATVMFR